MGTMDLNESELYSVVSITFCDLSKRDGVLSMLDAQNIPYALGNYNGDQGYAAIFQYAKPEHNALLQKLHELERTYSMWVSVPPYFTSKEVAMKSLKPDGEAPEVPYSPDAGIPLP